MFKALTVIVHGSQACGKTRNSEKIRKFFGCSHVVDDWMNHDEVVSGALHLTFEKPNEKAGRKAIIVSFENLKDLMENQLELASK